MPILDHITTFKEEIMKILKLELYKEPEIVAPTIQSTTMPSNITYTYDKLNRTIVKYEIDNAYPSYIDQYNPTAYAEMQRLNEKNRRRMEKQLMNTRGYGYNYNPWEADKEYFERLKQEALMYQMMYPPEPYSVNLREVGLASQTDIEMAIQTLMLTEVISPNLFIINAPPKV